MRTAMRAAGARLWLLPALFPAFNPIEQDFAKLKTLMRKAEERTIDAVQGSILTCVIPAECANYF